MHESEDEIVFSLPNLNVWTIEVIKNSEDHTKFDSKILEVSHIFCVFYAITSIFHYFNQI